MSSLRHPEPVIHVSLNYLADHPRYQTEKPYEMWTETLPPGLDRSNVEFDSVDCCELTDIRSLPVHSQPTLDREGFEIINHCYPDIASLSSIENISGNEDKRRAMRKYLSTMTEALRDQHDGVKAVCFDWRVRKATNNGYDKTPRVVFNIGDDGGEVREKTITAAFNVHGDGAPDNFKKQLLYLLTPDEQLELAEGKARLRLVNLWRPVVNVETGPLALCDVNTVHEDDWEPVDKVFGDWVEESMYLKHNPAQKWYWLSNQTVDEVTSFVIWDSQRPDDKKAAVAHCSFKLPEHLMGTVIRQSIEMRMMLWNELGESSELAG